MLAQVAVGQQSSRGMQCSLYDVLLPWTALLASRRWAVAFEDQRLGSMSEPLRRPPLLAKISASVPIVISPSRAFGKCPNDPSVFATIPQSVPVSVPLYALAQIYDSLKWH